MSENVAQPDHEAIIKAREEKIAAFSKQVEAVSTTASAKNSKERAEKGKTVSESMELSETETRYIIDEQLREYGGKPILTICAIPKGSGHRRAETLSLRNGHQCKEYVKGIKAEHKEHIISQWGVYKVPSFLLSLCKNNTAVNLQRARDGPSFTRSAIPRTVTVRPDIQVRNWTALLITSLCNSLSGCRLHSGASSFKNSVRRNFNWQTVRWPIWRSSMPPRSESWRATRKKSSRPSTGLVVSERTSSVR